MPFHHVLFGFLVSLVWGVNFVVMKIGLDHLSPFLFVALRFAIVFLLLFPWLRIIRGHMWLIFAVGVCLGGLHFSFAIMGLKLAENITSIIVIVQLHVPLTLIMAHFFLREKLSYWRGSGILVAFIGVLIISFDPTIVSERIAIIVIFGATMLYSIGAILMRKLHNVGVLNTQAWTAVFGLPILLSLSLFTETDQLGQITNMNLAGWGTVFYTAVLSSMVGYGGMNFLLRRHPVTLIAPIFLSTPLFATVAAVMVFDEVMTTRFYIGASFTMLGLAVIHIRDWWKKRQLVRELLP
ncbi:Permease of the drug/metabolite transporter (DMT) superfamily [hydrothermal vent metagenome]|uniref:Permease of the drug/metabolite transporter (DMT) superfamily n=1 Tax=hydrothermal vent metagenome TaxID=652676 RepID=A0A3B0S9A5_9ZZZZ